MVIVRADYLMLCDFNECAAALLNEFEHKANARLDDLDDQWAMPGQEAVAPDDWFFWSQDEIQRDLFFQYGERHVALALDLLVNAGLIQRRRGIRSETDAAYQYRLDIETVQNRLDNQGEKFDSALMRNRAAYLRNRAAKMRNIKESRVGEKTKTNTKDSRAEKTARPRDEIYDAISTTWNTTASGLIVSIKSILLGTSKRTTWKESNFDAPATADEIAAFGAWYKRKYPNNISLPNSPALIQKHFYDYRASLVKKAATASPDALRRQAEYDEWLHSLPVHDPKWSSYANFAAVSHVHN